MEGPTGDNCVYFDPEILFYSITKKKTKKFFTLKLDYIWTTFHLCTSSSSITRKEIFFLLRRYALSSSKIKEEMRIERRDREREKKRFLCNPFCHFHFYWYKTPLSFSSYSFRLFLLLSKKKKKQNIYGREKKKRIRKCHK